jgi:hypothetical protein
MDLAGLGVKELLDEKNLTDAREVVESWIRSDVFVWSNLIQILLVVALFFVAKRIAVRLKA